MSTRTYVETYDWRWAVETSLMTGRITSRLTGCTVRGAAKDDGAKMSDVVDGPSPMEDQPIPR